MFSHRLEPFSLCHVCDPLQISFLFVSLTYNDQIMKLRHTVFHTTCCAGVLYPSVSLTRGTNLFSMVSQYSAYSAGAERYSGNKLEQAEWTKGKMQQAGSGHGAAASPCSGSPAAVWLFLADASFCPAGQKEKCWEAMDSWWETWNFAKSYPVVGFTRGLDHFVSRKIS